MGRAPQFSSQQHLPRGEGEKPRGRRAFGAALLTCTILLATPAHADISVHASVAPARVQVGEPLALSIDIAGAQDAPAPAIGGIDGFDVRYMGPSTQISIINGRMNASVQHRYSLVPMRAGHFTLGPFSIAYQGK